jgi:hypothetical protein
MTDNTRDIAIQTKAELDAVREEVRAMSAKLDEVHDFLMRARGAQWAVYGIAGVIGFLAAKGGAWLSWLVQHTPPGVKG